MFVIYLLEENIQILNYKQLNSRQEAWVNNYFLTAIFPILTPLAVDPAHPFPFVSNLSLNIAVMIIDPENSSYQDNHRIGDHICYISDLSKMKSHYKKWNITRNLSNIFEEIYSDWDQRLNKG